MDILVRGNADEIDTSLVDFIKSTFKGKKVAVHIYEDNEMDETEYLLSDPIAKERLVEAVENVKHMRNLKEYTMEDINSYLNDSGT
ncbi:MAG: hypothetical protein LH478_03565 [Chitinophagaceae bacterium]|nr:hypothetical protein [Chitinophagaceae bacterium]